MKIEIKEPSHTCRLTMQVGKSKTQLSLAAIACVDGQEHAVFVSEEDGCHDDHEEEEDAEVFIFRVETKGGKIVSLHNADSHIEQEIFERFSELYT